jgi:hypothetical protein
LHAQGQEAHVGSVQGEGSGTMVQRTTEGERGTHSSNEGKYENLIFIFIVFLVGLVAGKMLMQ